MRLLKLFLVEDSQIVRERILGELAEMGGIVVVGQATGAAEARRVLAEQRADILLLDLSLAEGDGMDLLAWVKQVLPALVTLVMTNHAGWQYRQACLRLQADYFFDKSLQWLQALETIGRLRDEVCQAREAPVVSVQSPLPGLPLPQTGPLWRQAEVSGPRVDTVPFEK